MRIRSLHLPLPSWQRLGSWLLTLVILLASIACDTKTTTPEDLFAERSTGVVYIHNKRYFRIKIGPKTYYFSQIEKIDRNEYRILDWSEELDDGGLGVYASGFFVSDKGEILTSRDLISGEASFTELNAAIYDAIEGEISELDEELASLEEEERMIYDLRKTEQLDDEALAQQEIEFKDNLTRQRKLTSTIEALRAARNSYTIELICDLKVTYTGSAEEEIEYHPCTLLDVNKEDSYDLALIQLQTKQTPKGKYVFDLDNYVRWEDIKVGQRAYMIGFNEGLELARTGKGLMPQITSGEISREANPACVLYTTPTMLGSSGSPVMAESGELLALNYGGMPDATGFNFGVSMSAASAYYTRCKEEGLKDFRYIPRRIPHKETEPIDSLIAQNLLEIYYTGLKAEHTKLAVRAFSPYTVKYHGLQNTNRRGITTEIARYLKQYAVLDFEIKDFEQIDATDFRYKLEVQLEQRAGGTHLLYQIEGVMTCIKEEGSVYILTINDDVNRLLAKETKPHERVTSSPSQE